MRPVKSNGDKIMDFVRGKEKSADQIPESISSRHDRTKNQQFAGNSLPGHLQIFLTLLLAPLFFLGIWVSPSAADIITIDTSDCNACHGYEAWNQIHTIVPHTVTPGSGSVVLFADDAHDDAGWYPPTPYFAVTVDCLTCHAYDLFEIHGSNCATCHPTPYDTLNNNWQGGCQQGGCHPVYHADSITAHLPFEDPGAPPADCLICHEQPGWSVPQTNCLNCHAAPPGPGDTTPPVTTSDALSDYIGPARIKFSITDNGKVGIGTTYYRLDNNDVTTGMEVFVSDPGDHQLFFWSVDQAGNVESTKWAFFTIVQDTTPPTTTSNAVQGATYYNGAIFTLNASDNSTLGVKRTQFKINNGATQIGTKVTIPATTGTLTYTLTYWSEDWSGNIETPKSKTFTVKSGNGTIRLIWGDSENGNDLPAGTDWAKWKLRLNTLTGTIVDQGEGYASLGWDGVDNISRLVSNQVYYVVIDYQWNGDIDQTNFGPFYVRNPGEIVRFYY